MQKYKPYKKDANYSYTLGIFPTIELLETKPDIVQAVFVASGSEHSGGIRKLRSLCVEHGIHTEVADKVIARLARSDSSYAVGIFQKFSSPLQTDEPHVVLVNPDDAGNLGTIMRTMLGFGHRNLAIITPSVDAFDPKVVRASMGALFNQRVEHFDSIESYQAKFPHQLYPFLLEAGTLLADTAFQAPYSLVFGNEGAGLPDSYKHVGTPVRIEQSKEVNSLNLAVAASVALYRAYTQTK